MEGMAFWIIATAAAVLVGLGKGGLPVVAMLSVPLLATVISPVAAAGLLLPIYVVSDVFGLWAYRREFDWGVLKVMAPATTIGVGVGWWTAKMVSEDWVTGMVGVMGAVFAANLLLRHKGSKEPRPAEPVKGTFWGIITGFTSFVSHAGGPPYQVYVMPLQLSKAVFAGTSTILFAYVNAIKLVPYYFLGQFSVENLKVAAALMIPSALAVFAGVKIVQMLPEKLFFTLVTWALLVLSIKLIWQAAHNLL